MFPGLVFGPEVQVDLDGPDPPAAARAAVIEELVRHTLKHDANWRWSPLATSAWFVR